MNEVFLSGRLGRDPELRYTQSQMSVCNINLAVDRNLSREQRDAGKQDVDWIRVTVFGKQAENCEKYLTKGSKIIVHGRIQTGSYADKDGKKVFTIDVIANRVEFTSFGQQGQQNHGGSKNYSTSPMPDDYPQEVQEGFEMIDEDDVPF